MPIEEYDPMENLEDQLTTLHLQRNNSTFYKFNEAVKGVLDGDVKNISNVMAVIKEQVAEIPSNQLEMLSNNTKEAVLRSVYDVSDWKYYGGQVDSFFKPLIDAAKQKEKQVPQITAEATTFTM